MRLVEGLRYGGGVGQWSWLVHRVTGLGILLYLVTHIIDTFFVVVSPALYDHTIAMYGGILSGTYHWPLRWAFRMGELGLIACVLFHAINGIRVVLFDFWPRGALYQRQIFWVVLALFLGIMAPVTYIVVKPLAHAPETPRSAESGTTTAPAAE